MTEKTGISVARKVCAEVPADENEGVLKYYINAHYASDVVAGALLGWAVAHAVVRRHNGCPPKPDKLNWSLCAEGGGARLVFFKSF